VIALVLLVAAVCFGQRNWDVGEAPWGPVKPRDDE
jgi:hypothetical protein